MPIAHIVVWKLKNKDEETLNLFKPLYKLNGPTKLTVGEPLRPEKSAGYNYGKCEMNNNQQLINK